MKVCKLKFTVTKYFFLFSKVISLDNDACIGIMHQYYYNKKFRLCLMFYTRSVTFKDVLLYIKY